MIVCDTNGLIASPAEVDNAINLVAGQSLLVYPNEQLRVVKDDDADNHILECATAAEAEYLITGDAQYPLTLASYQRIKIVSPKIFAVHHGIT
jgi:hypothetical protein